MGRRDLPEGTALWLTPCFAIHTLFMRFPIDALFYNGDGVVLRLARDIRPWRWGVGVRGAAGVVEMRAGWLDASLAPTGAPLRLTPISPEDATVRGRESRPPE